MKTISIVILVCDKDAQYLPRLLNNIKSRVKVSHEVIIMDNTVKETIPNRKNILVVRNNFKRNAHQLDSRKRACDYATGEYVWFVDADDDVLKVPKWLNLKEDLIAFNYLIYTKEVPTKPKGNDINLAQIFNIGFACWNKWFKLSVLKEALSVIPQDTSISIFEDNLILSLFVKKAKSLHYISKPYYKFNADISLSCGKSFTTKEELSYYLTGFGELIGLFNKHFTEEELFNLYDGPLEYALINMIFRRVLPSLRDSIFMSQAFCDILIRETNTSYVNNMILKLISTASEEDLETYYSLSRYVESKLG